MKYGKNSSNINLEMSEYEHQKIVVEYLTLLEKQGKIITFFATNNENNTYKQNRKFAMIAEIKARKAGKKKGVSDLCIILKDKVVFLEMKKELKSAKPTKEQIWFLDKVRTSDVCTGSVCNGNKEAIEYINKLIGVE